MRRLSKAPRVSVITTFYNAESFLAEAVDSVLAQRGFDDWELLLVDDGSRDRSPAIARRYAAACPRQIRLFHHDARCNSGVSASRNLGLAHARGELVAFLDADDVWLPDTLRRQVAIMHDHPTVAMLYGAAERWFSWDASIAGENAPADYIVRPAPAGGGGSSGGEGVIDAPALLKTFLLDESQTPCLCAVMVRRTDVVGLGGFCDSFRGLYEDQVLYAKLCLGRSVYASTECWARYRQHGGSCCAVARRANATHNGRRKFLRWLKGYLGRGAAADPALVAVVDAEWARLGAADDGADSPRPHP